jgi:hypothetical protein
MKPQTKSKSNPNILGNLGNSKGPDSTVIPLELQDNKQTKEKEIIHLGDDNKCNTCFNQGKLSQIEDEIRFLDDKDCSLQHRLYSILKEYPYSFIGNETDLANFIMNQLFDDRIKQLNQQKEELKK